MLCYGQDEKGLPPTLDTLHALGFLGFLPISQFQEINSYTFYLATLGATYTGHSSMRHVHNLMTYTLAANNAWYYLYRAEFNRLCTQFEEKLCTLIP